MNFWKMKMTALLLVTIMGKSENQLKFEVIERRELQGVASASGFSAIGDEFYVVGDDSPYLFRLDSKMNITQKIQLMPERELPDSLFAKNIKPDFEAIATFASQKKLLIFGSGSNSPQRDVMVEVELLDPPAVKTFNLFHFYADLKRKAGMQDADLNIEAAEIIKDQLFLFNRGNNIILKYDLQEFYSFLNNEGGKSPEPEIFSFKLPEITGIEAGFSGATIHPDRETIIFTATVEDTGNWIDDGEVLGSMIGFINSQELNQPDKLQAFTIISKEGVIPIKVESLAVTGVNDENNLEVTLVTDSDGDVSEVLKGILSR